MILKPITYEKLAQNSYLIGCAATGEAIVIDPIRDANMYIDLAAENDLKIVAITETHIHADYLSGTRELSAATGAQMFLSDEGDENWKYAFAADPKVTLLKDGDKIEIGNLTLTAVHTPGHTPEHLAFLLVDHPAGEVPHSLFSGDFLFVGDVGRPDLLERAANIEGTMIKGAQTLFESLKKLEALPDSLLIWPGHGAGSACGKSLGAVPVTTLGYERKTNWALLSTSSDSFVKEILEGQPEPPYYFKEMKRLNKEGPEVLVEISRPTHLGSPSGLLVDIRSAADIRESYIDGSLAIPFGHSFPGRAGWLLRYDAPITLVTNDSDEAIAAKRDLAMIGLDVVAGWIAPSELSEPTSSLAQVSLGEVSPDDYLIDIRNASEWNSGHISGAHHLPLGYLATQLESLPCDRRIVAYCQSGGRSAVACSILKQAGLDNVAELRGGIEAVEKEKLVLNG
ncbi:MAG: MBL fold metallo-hydrolase [Chthonomonas sp.]|nr:MBL fold metallo-hydrolase [Chthonomonas sp.]